MADAITGNTELGATKQDLIASLVQRELAFRAKLLPYFTDVSNFAIPGAQSISFPKLTSFTVVDRSEGAAGDATALTATVDKLDLSINAYVAYIIDAMTKKQSNIQSEMEFAKRSASAHGRFVDSQIIAALAAGAASFENVGVDVDVTYANLTSMQEKYLLADGLMEDGVWIVSVSQNSAIVNLAEFKDTSAFGEMVIRDGYVKQILGMPVVIHNGLTAKELYLCSKESLAVGFQSAPAMDEQPANEFGVGATRVAVDQLFGIKALHTGEKGAAPGKSPLILGLND
ncbi:MAG: hypothetical protein CO099_02630 [Bdellovibrio sp. CG_4_9_14_3_um_filter_39_7]|nr:MAG: hypothetical protein CO099_02630 [Bdellovibrio sp. CG_4_9_14_3_um_filter_39_7]